MLCSPPSSAVSVLLNLGFLRTRKLQLIKYPGAVQTPPRRCGARVVAGDQPRAAAVTAAGAGLGVGAGELSLVGFGVHAGTGRDVPEQPLPPPQLAQKYDPQKEAELRTWIESVTGQQIGPDFQKGLKDGVILCE